MKQKGFFFSLKWKIAILIGSVFLLLHSTFSYLVYLDATEGFVLNRKNIQSRYSNIARALTKDSFLVLEQFTELISIVDNKESQNNTKSHIISTLDKNWQQWQYILGLEGAIFFSHSGVPVKNWGGLLNPEPSTVLRVLENESPDHQIICSDSCFQFVLIPIMAHSELVGVLGVSRSFADTVIEYNRATGSDIAVLVPSDQHSESNWPYKISAMTNTNRNHAVIELVKQEHLFDKFFNQRKVIIHNQQSFEMTVFPVVADLEKKAPPFFLVIEDISEELSSVNANFHTIWIYGIISLVSSLALLFVGLFFPFRRIINLSNAFSLLSKQKYDEFRQVLTYRTHLPIGYDELDILNQTALTLTDQLEGLEKEIKENICSLLDQGRELAIEKDFIQQLIYVAPVIVITQDNNGIILSINQTGIEEFFLEESLITGRVFDGFIPELEVEHLFRLRQLRAGEDSQHIKFDGVLYINETQQRHISWIHSVIKPKLYQDGTVILSLGVDISERKQIEAQMQKLAVHDQLTGLGNRYHFQEEFSREIAAAKRNESQLALFYLDLDQFKIVNDSCGHETGDKLLRLVSKTLLTDVRETDILSRIGGDEFTLIMSNADKQGIDNLANKINGSLMALDFHVEDKIYKISCSIGVAIYPQHGSDVHELLANADLAMYQAKDSGRGQHHIFLPDRDYQSRLTSRLYWKEIIEEALLNERFVLLFQPILDMQTNQVSHYECLSRIKTEEGEILMPGDFIGFAEELGLIGKIDRMVLKKAIEQHLTFKKQGKDIKLAVNLSGRSFNDTTIFKDIATLLSKPDVEPGQIIFEITETAAVSNFSAAQDLIKNIKELGCALALDDFGVGFSSFYYLKHLPVDYVKIDGSFIKQLDKNYEDKIFVKALTEVSQALGKKTVAEFVENEVILEVLKEFGIDYAQGYHIGKPGYID